MNARLHHNGRSQGCVGIDIGGTKIEGVLLDATRPRHRRLPYAIALR